MEQKPLPLGGGEEAEYLLALKQDFRAAMKTLPFFIRPAKALRDVERYSDKYHSSEQNDGYTWTPDWRRFPRELQVRRPPRHPGVSVSLSRSDTVQPALVKKKKKKKVKEKEEVLLKLETLEKKEEQQTSEEEGEERKKQEEGEEEEEYDEEEFEEETDYIMSYFDNGEEFGGDSDDNMDEAIY
ncbi:RNA polymerase III subunit GL b isoform X2 [Cololabis saira]|nr:RNA polymerase III subunit GL b isoform X2 [Cololabis saira]XP_061574131.1 RNA polymerase III subunit GL b isoform X2 [Cololabis saira]